MQTLQIKQLSPNATLPTRTHSTDAGLDIYASEDTQLVGYRPSRIPTGIAINIPAGYEGTIRPRSGKSSKTNARVILGTVDSGYNGEIAVIAETKGDGSYLVQKGEKIAQLVISPIVTPQLEIVDQFDTQSERGEKGFGSSDEREDSNSSDKVHFSEGRIRSMKENGMSDEQVDFLSRELKKFDLPDFKMSDEVHP